YGQPEALKLLDEDLERLRYARLEHVIALYNRFVSLHPADDVIAFHRQKLLKRVSGAVGFEGPDLHLAEALATHLSLAAQRLLCDQRVWTGGAGVNLLLDQVDELEHVDLPDGYRLVERLAGAAVVKDLAAVNRGRKPQAGV